MRFQWSWVHLAVYAVFVPIAGLCAILVIIAICDAIRKWKP